VTTWSWRACSGDGNLQGDRSTNCMQTSDMTISSSERAVNCPSWPVASLTLEAGRGQESSLPCTFLSSGVIHSE
jgi:hypothetical protein